jgi:hypothetical protein
MVWQCEDIASTAALETRLNELRVAGTGVLYILGNSTNGFTICFLEAV